MSSLSRKEALLNEYKGNLFEFLVSINLAKKFKIESEFIKSINSNFLLMLKQQESFIRTYFPELFLRLPVLANSLSDEITKDLKLEKINAIQLVGKSAAANSKDSFSEADIIVSSGNQIFPISLKLNKENTATNTKSAGVKSFLSKYFNGAEELQRKVNIEFDKKFDEFSFSLHDENGIEWDRNFNEWCIRGLATLPGELEGKSRDLYLQFLHNCSTLFYDALLSLSEDEGFYKSIFSLVGFSQSSVIQATCFHKNNYEEFRCEIFDCQNTIDGEFELINKNSTSYFEIKFKNLLLIIRIKAMNKFIHKSFKVNCSIKHL